MPFDRQKKLIHGLELETMQISILNEHNFVYSDNKLWTQSLYARGTQKKFDCFKADKFCRVLWTLQHIAWSFYQLSKFQEHILLYLKKSFYVEQKMREMIEMRKQYIEDKGFEFI